MNIDNMNNCNDIDNILLIITIIFEVGFDIPCHIVAGVLTMIGILKTGVLTVGGLTVGVWTLRFGPRFRSMYKYIC